MRREATLSYYGRLISADHLRRRLARYQLMGIIKITVEQD